MSTRVFILYVVTLLIFAQIITGEVGQTCRTHLLNSRKNLDLARFYGRWYRLEYAIFNKTSQPSPTKCSQIDYYPVKDESSTKAVNFKALALYQIVDSSQWEEDRANISVPDPDKSGVWISDWDLVSPPSIENVVLATDYNNWFYNYGCQMQEDNSPQELLGIWSRSRTINPIVREVLRNFMSGLGFSSSWNVIVDHTGCQ